MSRNIFRIISKLGLILVIIGFFMPVSCNISGFDFINTIFFKPDAPMHSFIDNPYLTAFLLTVMVISSFIGVLILLSLIRNKNIHVIYDWIVVFTTIFCGIIVLQQLNKFFDRNFQYGGYIIIIGWIISFFGMVLTFYDKK